MTQITYQVGGILLLASVILIASFCRELISRDLREGMKKLAILGMAVVLVYAGVQAYSSSFPTLHSFWGGTPAASTASEGNVPTPPPARDAMPHPKPAARAIPKVTAAEREFLTQPPPMLHISGGIATPGH